MQSCSLGGSDCEPDSYVVPKNHYTRVYSLQDKLTSTTPPESFITVIKAKKRIG